jgi:hypothetical protein
LSSFAAGAAGDLVGQDELEEVGVGHLLLAGQGEPLGQDVERLAELEGRSHVRRAGPRT